MDIHITDYQFTVAAGIDKAAFKHAVKNYTSGLQPNDLEGSDVDTWVGKVSAVDDIQDLGVWQSRNNALAALGLAQGSLQGTLNKLIAKLGSERIGLVIGSSTSSIDRTELAYHHLDAEGKLSKAYQQSKVHNPHGPGLFVAQHTGIDGPAITINTACSSSAKVFASASRWLSAGIVDAVLVGGVDSLCLSVIHGFNGLQLVSANPCKPFDHYRDGINIGEAAGFAILQRRKDSDSSSGLVLSGYGESSDAHHMSHPHPEGLGARMAIEAALARAQLKPEQIDYINLHGTASQANDAIEGKLISELFPATTQCSSTKGWTGHTLGAAGIVESLAAVQTLETGLVPGNLNLEHLDEAMDFSISPRNLEKNTTHVMSNSFGFGGNNCSLIFSKADQV